MPRADKLLFNKYPLGAVIEAQAKAAFAAIDALADSDNLNPPKETLVEDFARQFHLELPVLAEDQRHVTNEEAEIAAYDSWDRCHVRARGYRVTLFIPFTGDADLFLCRPSTFTLNPPRACIEPGI